MHGLAIPISLVNETEAAALFPLPPRLSAPGSRSARNDCEHEEPEILRLLAAHFRAMLMLPGLTDRQRHELCQSLADCESRLPGHANNRPCAPLPPADDHAETMRQPMECLTAIRLYAAGAQQALSRGRPEAVAHALAAIGISAARADSLLAGHRPSAHEIRPTGSATGSFDHDPVG